jgi:hypothetical protein
VLCGQTSFWKNVIEVGTAQPLGLEPGPPYSLYAPLAPQSGHAVLLQCGTQAGSKLIWLPAILMFSVFHMHPSHQSVAGEPG